MRYSNCLFEAIISKLKNPNVKIYVYPPEINDGRLHFYWIKDNTVYHYTHRNKNESFLFKGIIKTYKKESFEKSILHKMYINDFTVEQAYKLSQKYHLPFTKDNIEISFKNEELL